jgi:integrase
MGENTPRALASDLGYLEEWARLATGSPLRWPAPEAMLLKFVAHHLWDPVKRAADPTHGMPPDVEVGMRKAGLLKALGPHAPDTVRRRLTSWSILTRWRGLVGNFSSPPLKTALRLAVRASNRPRRRKSTKAVTGDVLAQLLATCRGDGLVAMRDRALLLLAFASGGRRRSEAASRGRTWSRTTPYRRIQPTPPPLPSPASSSASGEPRTPRPMMTRPCF